MGKARIQKNGAVTVLYKALFGGIFPYIALKIMGFIDGKYLHLRYFRILEFPLTSDAEAGNVDRIKLLVHHPSPFPVDGGFSMALF